MPAGDACDDWFLSASERGNDSTRIDRAHADGRAWTEGNEVVVCVDGADYFRRLHTELDRLAAGDRVYFTDWRGDADERLDGPGTEIGAVLGGLARRGVDVRGLVWRSHADQLHFSERENLRLTEAVNGAGGEVLLDERVRRAGSHHQKLVLVRHRDDRASDVAFVGGVDLGHGRRDDSCHRGDPQAIELDARYGTRPRWHDVQLAVRGPAVADLECCFRERWDDPLRLDHRVPWRTRLARIAREPSRARPLPNPFPPPPAAGPHAVQVLRTYPAKRPPYPFAPAGERSVARAYLEAFARARRLIYVEDQYLWSPDASAAICRALEREPRLRVVAVVPRYPDRDDPIGGPPYRVAQHDVIRRLRAAGGDRVAVYDLESPGGAPIYVHAKVCIVDDVWMAVGSDNLNRRSWTNDSELTCAVIDTTPDDREPNDPGGRGDGARRLARATRLRLWREHLGGLDAGGGDELPTDPDAGFAAFRAAADALDAWHRSGCRGPRPRGRVRHHHVEPVAPALRPVARAVYRAVVDPDGRPAALRRAGEL